MSSPAPIHMPERPVSDRDLDADIVRAALLEELPHLDARTVEPLGSGWASDIYLVDEDLVVRFPRNTELARWLERDEAILGLVHSRLAESFAVPEVVFRGKGGRHVPHGFLVCSLVPGIGADDPRAPESDHLAADLGWALTRIHSVPVEAAAAIGLDHPHHDDHPGPPRFLHGDFSPDNVMVDPRTGRLTGVIDWGNAAIGDPAVDFVGLVLWRGWGFAESVVDAYRGTVEEGFLDRVRYHAQIRALEWLTDTIKRRGDPALHLRWVRNAFSLGAS